MLSKLRFAGQKLPGSRDSIRTALEERLSKGGTSPASVTSHSGGTLGLGFVAETPEGTAYIKTHLPDEALLAGCRREAAILQALYGRQVVFDCFELCIEGKTHFFIVMKYLAPLGAPLAPAEASHLIDEFTASFQALDSQSLASLTAGMPGFDQLLLAAQTALDGLAARGMVVGSIFSACESKLHHLARESSGQPRLVCHGDFGSHNVMTDGQRLFAIDWEDVLWGIPGYDLCYHLTFMDQRPYYTDGIWDTVGIDPAFGSSIMVAVTLIKSYVAVLEGRHKSYKLPIDARLDEIIHLGQ